MNNLPLLLKREYWEHRGGFFWTPFWVCVAILVVTALGIVSAEVFNSRANVHMASRSPISGITSARTISPKPATRSTWRS